ncbi:Exosome complex component RRP45 [Holothuria leucospilota]|uniref:Exosome complex component RRP45 n=1 Tax=Holothuria leucospilota TaxID=206669 RepID=A0A9Q1BKY7_HOLLE|nr:Exosome complex component RRP45 [Holothuria leucospilota]
MKDIISTAEKQFLLSVISNGKRLDGRDTYDYRKIRITFGTEKGCCEVQLGNTRVLAQTSCEVVKPSASRPSEGSLQINLELSPMASPSFEPGRMSSYGVELNRLLERSVRESKAVDTESLCIVVGEKVWQVRVDLHALNFDGNLLDCSSIAAIASLHHFRRPEVTVSGEEVTVHSLEDREPVALSIHHMPICITFAFFQEGKYLLVDPTGGEETVMDGCMVVCMNVHRELCTVQMTGSMLLLKDQLSRCCQIAVVKVSEITDVITTALENDAKARKEGKKFGFAESKVTSRITSSNIEKQTVPIKQHSEGDGDDSWDEMEEDQEEEEAGKMKRNGSNEMESNNMVNIDRPGVGTIGEGLQNTWVLPEEESEDEEKPSTVETGATKAAVPNHAASEMQRKHSARKGVKDEDSGSEEEETMIVSSETIQESKKPEPIVQQGEVLDLSLALKNPSSTGPAGQRKKGKGAGRKKQKMGPK